MCPAGFTGFTRTGEPPWNDLSPREHVGCVSVRQEGEAGGSCLLLPAQLILCPAAAPGSTASPALRLTGPPPQLRAGDRDFLPDTEGGETPRDNPLLTPPLTPPITPLLPLPLLTPPSLTPLPPPLTPLPPPPLLTPSAYSSSHTSSYSSSKHIQIFSLHHLSKRAEGFMKGCSTLHNKEKNKSLKFAVQGLTEPQL
ncbi:unnamed protein product [Pleuronectes platessa]|uniref:Uncharacterized protein n=1 Tax=Pleuronectes platessa TaxID=8262 RepID=A0A9N7UPA5_PLEPL|nr:unnamed protein product [Pleuronectes platessa]